MSPERRPAPSSADVQATFCATLVDEWERSGLTDAVVSPGSRSTPLALALVRAQRLRTHVVLDERSASFLALGLARATGRAVLLLCTSGTAAVEFHAAVAEADLDRVPLVVCTADRPPELHRIGAPQTLDQHRLFGVSVRWAADLGVASEENRSAWRSFAARAVIEATGGPHGPGPVQLNLPFREPLVGVAGELPEGRDDGNAWHRRLASVPALSNDAARTLVELVGGRRGVVVAGAEAGAAADVVAIADRLGWPLLADPRSGCRLDVAGVVAPVDALLRIGAVAAELAPEVVLRLGAPWASKVLNTWLAQAPVDVLCDPHGAWLDPARRATVQVGAGAAAVRAALDGSGVAASPVAWRERWVELGASASASLAAELDGPGALDGVPTDAAVARALAAALPDGAALVVSSSMPVRDVEWYAAARSGLSVHANRGVNGIDGVVSTVAGVALGGAPTVGLLGDLALLHDLGGLVSVQATGAPAVLVVVDNAGGAIFEFLPQATTVERSEFERLFGTPQPVDVAAAARGVGVDTVEVATVRELVRAVCEALDARRARVVVIRTDRVANVAAHDRIHAAVAAALAG